MANLGLDPDRVSSLDEHGHRRAIIPAEVRGRFRRWRTIVQAVLIIFFLVLPWLKIGGHQALLIDLPHRQFAVFGLMLYAHDAPLVFFLLAMATLGLAFVTAVWGRVWCGWACPQTVFIDGIFRRIERLIEGTHLQRRALAAAPMSLGKLTRQTLKWTLFVLVSSIIAHSFAAVFIGSERLLRMMAAPPTGNETYFFVITALTAVILFDFAWFREQFCIIMCPYGRVQSVLMDDTSLAVTYDIARGEPRKGTAATEGAKNTGDCVACNRCVNVCPTGIDIRKGVQMECIACTACIDACDEIMDKVHKPRGLIRYSNDRGTSWTLRKPRALIYAVFILISIAGLTLALGTRTPLHVAVLRAPGDLFVTVTALDGTPQLANHLRLHLKNQTSESVRYRLEAMAADGPVEIKTAQNPFVVSAGADLSLHLFAQFARDRLSPQGDLAILLKLTDIEKPEHTYEFPFRLLGPAR